MSLAIVERDKAGIIARAKHIVSEIDQMFRDAEYWNSRNPNEPPIDADPDGTLRQLRVNLEAMIGSAK